MSNLNLRVFFTYFKKYVQGNLKALRAVTVQKLYCKNYICRANAKDTVDIESHTVPFWQEMEKEVKVIPQEDWINCFQISPEWTFVFLLSFNFEINFNSQSQQLTTYLLTSKSQCAMAICIPNKITGCCCSWCLQFVVNSEWQVSFPTSSVPDLPSH